MTITPGPASGEGEGEGTRIALPALGRAVRWIKKKIFGASASTYDAMILEPMLERIRASPVAGAAASASASASTYDSFVLEPMLARIKASTAKAGGVDANAVGRPP